MRETVELWGIITGMMLFPGLIILWFKLGSQNAVAKRLHLKAMAFCEESFFNYIETERKGGISALVDEYIAIAKIYYPKNEKERLHQAATNFRPETVIARNFSQTLTQLWQDYFETLDFSKTPLSENTVQTYRNTFLNRLSNGLYMNFRMAQLRDQSIAEFKWCVPVFEPEDEWSKNAATKQFEMFGQVPSTPENNNS